MRGDRENGRAGAMSVVQTVDEMQVAGAAGAGADRELAVAWDSPAAAKAATSSWRV
jgi:hypothetical protein